MTEHDHQRLIVAWFRDRYPELEGLFFAIPNGGRRDAATAARLKAEGVRAGVPDLLLAVARSGRHGLWIEMKTAKGCASKAQREMRDSLSAQGYAVEIAKGYAAAKAIITEYLSDVV
jgi:hypothetical protein